MAQLSWTQRQRRQVLSCVGAAVILFMATAGASIFFVPDGISSNLGLSVFGTRDDSATIFTFGLGSAALCLMAAGVHLFRVPGAKVPGYYLIAIGIFLIGVVVTPFTRSPFIGQLHRQIGSCLFAAEFLLAVWLLIQVRPPRSAWILLGVMILSALLVMMPNVYDLALSAYAQLSYQLSFSVILLTSLKRVLRITPQHSI